MLKFLKIEIAEKECSASLGYVHIEHHETNRANRFTTHVLLTSIHLREKVNKLCVFCSLLNHPPLQCPKISNSQDKRAFMKRNSLCFICFTKGHLSPACTLKNYSCKGCN